MTELGDYRRLVEKPMIEAHIAELRRKDAEIERLRAALFAICKLGGTNDLPEAWKIAEDALEQKARESK